MAEIDPAESSQPDGGSPPSTPASAAEPARETSGRGSYDFGELLSEFDKATASRNEHSPEAPPTPGEQAPATPAEPRRSMSDQDMWNIAIDHAAHKELWQSHLARQHFAALRQQENEDFREVLAHANKELEGLPNVPEDFAKRWLVAEYNLNPELQKIWDSVVQIPAAARANKADEELQKDIAYADKFVRRTIKRMVQEARAFASYDHESTTDRAAVAEAVRGTSTKVPEGKAPDYSSMSNAEFREAHKKAHGYYPSV